MKKLLTMAAVAALLITGCASELKVAPAKELTVEYGEKLDNSKLFNAKESDENVKVEKVSGFDAKKLGDQELTVTFTDGDKSKDEKITITIKDTKAPAIELKKDTVTITEGDELKLQDNVKSVKDPVDGNLKYSEKEVEKDGYYIDKGKLDTKKAGTYEIKVVAVDKNGNKTEESFSVKVKEKKEEKKETPKSEKNTTTASSSKQGSSNSTSSSKRSSSSSSSKPSSNGSSTSSKPSNNLSKEQQANKANCESEGGTYDAAKNDCSWKVAEEAPKDPSQPHEHVPEVLGWDTSGYGTVEWSGIWFNNKQEAAAYAEGPYLDQYSEEHDGGGFNYQFRQCSCGKYTIFFWNFS